MSPTDADLMARVQSGETDVFGLLVTRYAPRLLRVAQSKQGDAALAEDIVQETFVAAFQARHSYRPEFAVSTWLWTILLNRCRRHWKRTHARSVSVWETWDVERPDPVDEQSPSALDAVVRAEDRRRLHALLDELPEAQADALRLRFFGGLTFDEIATTMECSLSGAKRRVKTGLQRLSQLIRSLEQPDEKEMPGLRKEDRP